MRTSDMKLTSAALSTALKCCVVIHLWKVFIKANFCKINIAPAINLCPSSRVAITDKPLDRWERARFLRTCYVKKLACVWVTDVKVTCWTDGAITASPRGPAPRAELLTTPFTWFSSIRTNVMPSFFRPTCLLVCLTPLAQLYRLYRLTTDVMTRVTMKPITVGARSKVWTVLAR
jgi:hypothetical protein